ncbi:MAG: aldo/keto reductase [Candidatus Micrarchaeota archaeon]|nr:aldo/keto reductase [Candidatus Micrarchaeota archaeon]
MKIPSKRLKNGFEMPVFGIGTWRMGGRFERDPSNDDDADIQAIKNAIDLGITHIDTAERYAEGYAETLVGRAIGGTDRKKLFIVSKVAPYNLTYDGIIAAAKRSLERLQTDYLDLYLIHAPNPGIPIKESVSAMDYLADQGMVRSIGLSNFNPSRFEEAQSHARHKIIANQVHYNLIFREIEREGVLDYCQNNDVMLIAWRPVEKGALTGKGIKLLDDISQKYRKTQAQIAINWLASQPNVVTLSKMRNIDHLRENLGGIGWTMDGSDIERLRKEFPGQKYVSDAVPLI